MSSSVYRYSATAIPGSLITFGLMMFMVALVFTAPMEVIEKPPVKVGPIFLSPRVVEPFPKPAKPSRIEQVAITPTVIEHPPLTEDRGKIRIGNDEIDLVKDKPNIKFGSTGNFIPVYVPQPAYPNKAIRQGVGGYAVVSVTITTAGNVRNPVLLEEFPEGYGFGGAALKAAQKLKYSPRMEDGTPVEVPGVTYKFSFAMEN